MYVPNRQKQLFCELQLTARTKNIIRTDANLQSVGWLMIRNRNYLLYIMNEENFTRRLPFGITIVRINIVLLQHCCRKTLYVF